MIMYDITKYADKIVLTLPEEVEIADTDTIYKNSDLIYSIRPPEELQLDIFKERWIPKEEAYFETFQIKQKSDIIVTWKKGTGMSQN